MAGKQYEMLFKLGAQLDQKFNGTFASAQKTLNATQKEIQALNKQQGDIASYQKQQAAIENTNKRLEMYREQLKNVQREKAEDGKATSDLVNKELALKRRIEETEQKLADQNTKLRQMGQNLTEAGISTDHLKSTSMALEQRIEMLSRAEEEAAEEAKEFGDAGVSSAETVASALAAAGIVAALNKIFDAYKECVGISMEFGSTMSTVEALSGATAVEMRALTAQAKELGATTAFTANQSAQAMTYMGMAGWDASEMMSGLDGVISLAAASGEDLAMVSDIVTDNLTAFKLTAKDTAHFSDVLAQAASKSNTSVAIMGETFKGSASVAGALGYSIEDVAVAVGLMANSGVKGSIANTALKNTFNGLLNGATLTGKAFGEVEYTAVNADGTMKAFGDTIDELRVYFDQMTEAERVNNAMAIAGQRGYNGLLAILNATDEDYASLTDSINNCSGAAQRMAEIKLDNLKGDVTLLDSAAEGLKNTIGGMYDDELRGIAQIGTEILTGINSFCEKNPAVVKGIMTMVAGLGLVVTGYTAYTAIKKVSNTLSAAGIGIKASENGLLMLLNVQLGKNAAAQFAAASAQMKLNAAMLANPTAIITTAIIALTAVLVALDAATQKARLETMTLTTASNKQVESVERLNSEYDEACTRFGNTSNEALALKYDLDEATAALNAQSFSVSELYAEIDALHDSTAELLSSFNEGTDGIASQHEEAQILAAKLKDIAAASDTAAAEQAKIAPIVERLNKLYPSLGLTVDNVSDKLSGLSGAIDKAANAESLQAKYKAAQENIAGLTLKEAQLQEAAEKAQIAFDKAYFREKTVFENVRDYSFVGNIFGKSDYANDYEQAAEERNKVLSDLAAVRAEIAECESVGVEYEAITSGTSEKIVDAYTAVSFAVNGVTGETQNLLQAYNDAYQAAYDSVSGQYNLWTEAKEAIPTTIGTINNALESQADYWDKYKYNLDSLSERTKDIDGLSEIIASFADGSKESVNAIAGLADASDDELKELVKLYRENAKMEQEVSESLARYRVDINSELDKIVNDTQAAVDQMKMEDRARDSAKCTIDAYAEEILAGRGKIVDASEYVRGALDRAWADANKMVMSYDVTSYSDYAYDDINAYAGGTDYAKAGVALVGEEGPELVMMRGGEQVFTAEDTKALFSDGGSKTEITISPNIVIAGDVSEDTEERIKASVIDAVLEALEQAKIDKKRSAYA